MRVLCLTAVGLASALVSRAGLAPSRTVSASRSTVSMKLYDWHVPASLGNHLSSTRRGGSSDGSGLLIIILISILLLLRRSVKAAHGGNAHLVCVVWRARGASLRVLELSTFS